MNTNSIEEPGLSPGMSRKKILATVLVVILGIGVFFVVRYYQYLNYLKTTETELLIEEGISPKEQQGLTELDRLRAEYQATFNPPATTSVESQLKSLDALRKKTISDKQVTTTSEEQQLREIDTLRAHTQVQ